MQIDDLNEQPKSDTAGHADAQDDTAAAEAQTEAAIDAENAESAQAIDAESADSEADDAEESDQEDDVKVSREKVSFFKKHEKKDKRDEKIAELEDRQRRLMAEFENFRKRTEKEKASMYDYGAKSTLEKILPVVDSFERGIAAIKDDERELASVQGFEKIYKLLIDALEKAGATAMEATGKPFDPEYHSAVMHTDEEGAGENLVAEEMQKGYMYHDSVLRHAMVRVVN